MTDQAPQLTPRERQVLTLLCTGTVSNAQLAAALTTSVSTAEFHVKQLMGKFEVSSRAELVGKAWAIGVVDLT